MPWLVRLVAGFSSGMPALIPLPVHVRFVVSKLALGQAFICDYFTGFPSQYHCCMLIYLLILVLLDGQAGEDWEPTKNATLYRISWNFGPGNLQTRQCSFGHPGTLFFFKKEEANIYTYWTVR